MILYVAQPRYPLFRQVLMIFFPFATIPAMPHCPEFTDRYSSQYDRLLFSLHFMTQTFFQLSSPHFHLVSQSHDQSTPMYATIHDLTDRVLVVLLPPSLSHSSDLDCVRAQRIMFQGRFLVQLTHLLSGGPRLAMVWLILNEVAHMVCRKLHVISRQNIV